MQKPTKIAVMLTSTLSLVLLATVTLPASAAPIPASAPTVDLSSWVNDDAAPCPDEVCTACLLGWIAACAGAPEVFICKTNPTSGLCECCGKCQSDLEIVSPGCSDDAAGDGE
jgi:hypothetical protein